MIVVSLFLSLVCLTSSAPSGGCGTDLQEGSPSPGEHRRFTVSVSDPGQGEVSRSFLLHLPARYDTSNGVKVPLVLDFHCSSCTADFQMSSPWPQVADEDQEGFVYVALEGGRREHYYNTLHCLPPPQV